LRERERFLQRGKGRRGSDGWKRRES
jgi:hypothetical protein